MKGNPMDLDADRLRAALRRTRIGHVTCREHGPINSVSSRSPSAVAAHIEATVPGWLIPALENGSGRSRAKLSVFSASQHDELWAVLSMQRGDAPRLCLVLPIDDEGVQRFLRHGLQGGALRLALETDDGELSATVDLGLPLGDARTLELVLQRARHLPGSLTRLAQFVEASSPGTLLSGLRADTVAGADVVVLVSNRAHELVNEAHDHGRRNFPTL